MKTQAKQFLIFLVTLTILSSCKKDEDEPPISNTTYSSLQEFYDKHSVKSQFFTITNASQQVITGNQGTVVTFPAGSLIRPNGQAASGSIRVELKEIYKKSDMMYADIPTMSANGPLKSGGEVFLQAIQESNGEILQVVSNTPVEIFMPDSAAVDSMMAFIPAPDSMINGLPAPFMWEPWIPGVSSGWTTELFYSSSGFQIFTDTLTWINSDQPLYSNPWIKLDMHPTDNIQDYSTDVFLFFPERTMIHVYKNYQTGDFTNAYTPENSQPTIVAIGMKNGKLYSAIIPVSVTTADLTVDFTLQETTEAALTAAINAMD